MASQVKVRLQTIMLMSVLVRDPDVALPVQVSFQAAHSFPGLSQPSSPTYRYMILAAGVINGACSASKPIVQQLSYSLQDAVCRSNRQATGSM